MSSMLIIAMVTSPVMEHWIAYKRCVHRHRTLYSLILYFVHLLTDFNSVDTIAGEGGGHPWPTGVGLVRLSLHRDVRTSVYCLFYTGRIYWRALWRSGV